jgi:hypothetical protein
VNYVEKVHRPWIDVKINFSIFVFVEVLPLEAYSP